MAQVKGLKLYTDNWYFDFYNSLFYGLMFSNFVFFSAVELFSIRQPEWILAFASTRACILSLVVVVGAVL